MVSSLQNTCSSKLFSPTIRASVRIAEFDLKKTTIFKVVIVKKVKIFDLLVLTFKVPNFFKYL